jgi:osmotically-inducible protein OsmY
MFKIAVFGVALGLLAGCSTQPKSADVKDSITQTLKGSGYADVSVSQDREKGVVTLGGHVQSQEDKTKAESLAKGIAGGQTVADEILVQPPASAKIAKEVSADEDAAIQKNLDAVFASAGLKGVKHKTKNGVVTLTGSVSAEATRSQAELAAQQTPNVQQVVNELQASRGSANPSGN